jgi:HTH-type transcriptional repressor of NAD biosynthesis genes
MYGGKFLPIHMGHVYAMIRASTMVDELHVCVVYDEEYEMNMMDKEHAKMPFVSAKMRMRWWTMLTKDMPHVHVHVVEQKETGNGLLDWKRGANAIKSAIGKPIDTIFSSEYDYDPIFKALYPGAEHVVIDNHRTSYHISGTQIRREGVFAHWNMIPDTIKPFFVKKVVVIGTESCGKSTLISNLAKLYNTEYVEEWGRIFYERLGNCDAITMLEDYPEIAYEHKVHEREQQARANKILFVDTEALVTQYYCMAYLGARLNVLDEIIKKEDYDLWLFLEPDVKWVNDGTRTFGEDQVRHTNNEMLKGLLHEHGIEYTSISGDYTQRLTKAIEAVNKLF